PRPAGSSGWRPAIISSRTPPIARCGTSSIARLPCRCPKAIMTPQEIGQRIKALRIGRQWTLQALSRRSKVSISALSKIENAQVAASFDTLLRIARGFGLGFDAMLNVASARRPLARRPATRFTLTRGGAGLFFSTDMYEYEVHSAELRRKHMIPLHMEVKARQLSDLTRWSSHEGEEFIYVLKGRIELHTEFHA